MQLGKYEIIRELGRGGFGIVYEAKDLTLDRMVALKVLLPQLAADVEFVRRFQHEAKSLAKLEHPNIVPVYEINEVEGRYFIAMRYLPGGSMADRLANKGPLLEGEVLSIARQLVAGLSHAHAKGLTHCDIKPNNILFDGKGNVLISDFGLARAAQSNSSGTSIMSAAAGTPSYMPPEMWEEGQVTPAVDQYSLACVLCEALTAKKLFDGDTTPRIMTKHFQPLVLPEGIPVGLREVFEKALSKNPDERYSNLNSFFTALEVSHGKEHKFGVTPADNEVEKTPEASQETAEASSIDGTLGPKKPERVDPAPKEPRKAPGRALLLGIVAVLMIAVSTGIWANYQAKLKPPAPIQSPAELFLPIATLTDALTGTPTETPWITPTKELTEEPIATPSILPTIDPTENLLVVPTIEPSEAQVSKTEPDYGETRIREMDGMKQVYVPAGKFTMGSEDGAGDEKPVHEVYLDGYWIDKYEVSNAQYEKCVKEAGFCFSFGSKSSTQEIYYGNPIYADYPKIFISWDSAKSYCDWVGGRLPTEAEWEKAARGDADERTYPWGEGIDSQKANYGGNVGDTTRVGSYPTGESPYGVMDMAGNVWEWVSDLYQFNYYDTQAEWSNPTGASSGDYHILRGGSWNYGHDYQRVSIRYNMYRYLAVNNTGFRCVSSP